MSDPAERLPTDEERAAFKQSELKRWYDGECAERVAAERRATVERIRERYAMHGGKFFKEWLDAEADR